MICLVRLFSIALCVIIWRSSYAFASDCIALEHWTFTETGSSISKPIRVGFSLTDPIQGITNPAGSYATEIVPASLSRFDRPAIYIPSIGGLSNILIDGVAAVLPVADYASVGPVVPLVHSANRSRPISIELIIRRDTTSYAGLWKSSPVLCDYSVSARLQAVDDLWQRRLPNATAVLCLALSALFWAIFHYTGKRLAIYKLFAIALLLWAPFFLVLSGYVREFSYEFGTRALFLSRVTAGFGLMLLFYSYRERTFSFRDRALVAVAGIFVIACFVFTVSHQTTLQLICLVGTVVLHVPIILDVILLRHTAKRFYLLAAVSTLAGVGEVLDLFKLLGPRINFVSPLPYLNRLTLPPVLLFSAGYFLWHFVQYFRDSRINEFRHRILGHLALRLARVELREPALIRISRAARRLHFARRASVAKRTLDGSYVITGVSGFDSEAIGDAISLGRHPHIGHAVRNGELAVAHVSDVDPTRYSSDFSLAVPIPLRPNPEYLVLISDIRSGHRFETAELGISRHFFSALSADLVATQERDKREARDKEVQNMLRRLDPNLYEYVQRNVESETGTIDETCERGVVFFDQKAYTTMLERLHPTRAAKALSMIKKWVGTCSLRQNARLKGFYGDAYVIEVYPLLGEPQKQTVLRTAKLAWNLSETVDSLNQELIGQQFPPIAFRFGAHFGLAANVDMDIIEAGTSTLIGDAVNLAQRIQAQAPTGNILVSGSIAEVINDTFAFEPIERKYFKGRSGIISLYRIVGIIGDERNAA